MKDLRRVPRDLLAGSLLLLSVVAFTGCGDDDDDPTDPGPPAPEAFTQEIAVNQVLSSVNQTIRVLDEVPGYADGVGAKVEDGAFTWDEADERWEATATYDQLGYAWNLDLWVQYLDAGGLPEQDVDDAERMRMGYSGNAHYAAGGVVIDRMHDATFSIINLVNTPELPQTVFGGGSWTMDYTRPVEGETVTTHHEVNWEIDDEAGIQLPDLGCPLGSVTFDFDPYELRLEFVGTASANYVLVDAENDPVAEGTGTTTLNCGL